MAELELVAVCQQWLDSNQSNGSSVATAATAATSEPADEEVSKPSKKRKRQAEEETPVEEKAQVEAAETEVAEPKAKKNNKAAEKASGTPFKRFDEDYWKAQIKDDRLRDNTHLAKQRFGGGVGDTWADKASEDLLKVKGKGFRKEMMKKKKASWRGGGELDFGVNSVKFSDSEDE